MTAGRARLLLLGLALLVPALRLLTYDEPIEHDAAHYLVVAQEMLAGKLLYAEIWEHKPPGTMVLFALAESVLGVGEATLYALGLAAALATLLGLYAAGRHLTQDPRGGLWAAGLWTVLSMTPYAQADMVNTEAFLNAVLVWSLVVLLRAGGRPLGWGAALGLGAIAAAASMLKQVALPALALAATVHLLGWGGEPPLRRGVRLLRLAVGFSLVPLSWAALWLFYVVRGAERAFVDSAFTYNAAYVQPLLTTLAKAVGPEEGALLLAALAPPLIGLLLPAGAVGEGRRAAWWTLVALTPGVWIAVAAPGHFYLHYYQYWLPLLCLALAVAWDLARSIPRPRALRNAHLLCLGLLAGTLLPHLEPFLTWTPEDWSRAKYRDEFVTTRQWGRHLRSWLRPEETLWNLGANPSLYVYSGKRPPTRVLVDYPYDLVRQRDPRVHQLGVEMIEGTAAELRRAPPDLVVARSGHPLLRSEVGGLGHPISRFLAEGYARLGPEPPGALFVLLVRRDSPLLQRVSPQALRPALYPPGAALAPVAAESP